jgi:hypothetical protein
MKRKSYAWSLLLISILFALINTIKGQGELFNVEFNVDMTEAQNFDPESDIIYMTGSMLGWAEPGTQIDDQLMIRVGTTMIWTKTLQLEAGEHQYKYFKNDGWMNGEWGGEPNRVIQITEDLIVNDVWGTLLYSVTFNVDMTDAESFDPLTDIIYLTGSMLEWAEPGTQVDNQLLSRVGTSMIWSKTLQLAAGNYEYRYFKNDGWLNPEFGGSTNRWMEVNQDITISDIWGFLEVTAHHDVTFNVDMSLVPNFDPENDLVYITGSFFDWAMPGNMPDEQLMTRIDGTMIWTKTLNLQEGGHAYKYFINYGWDRGEWPDLRSRNIFIDGINVFDDYWGNCFPASIPISQNFDDQPANYKPDCWHINGSNDFHGLVSDFVASNLPNSLQLFHGPSSHVLLISPFIAENLSELQVSFKASKSYYNQESLPIILGVMSDQNDPSSFEALATFTLHNQPDQPWVQFNYYLENFSGNANYIAFKGMHEDPSSWYEAFIDDIVIDIIPDCPPPHQLDATNITTTEAQLGWTERGTANQWDVLFGLQGFQPENGGTLIQNLSEQQYLVQGLEHSTHYDFYVRSICGTEPSAWSFPSTYTTTCFGEELSINYPTENLTFDITDGSPISINYDFRGCADFWVNTLLVNENGEHIMTLSSDYLTGTATINRDFIISQAFCSGNYYFLVEYWNEQTQTYHQHESPLFTITNNNIALELTSPYWGMTMVSGVPYSIQWNASTDQNVSFHYSLNDGVDWIETVTNHTSVCGYLPWGMNNMDWVVPESISGYYPECRLKISLTDNPEIHFISNLFSITSETQAWFLAPMQGQIVAPGDNVDVSIETVHESWADIFIVKPTGDIWWMMQINLIEGINQYQLSTSGFEQGYNYQVALYYNYTSQWIYSEPFAILNEIPACHPPFNIEIGDIGASSAIISWNAWIGEPQWNIEYGISGFAPGNGTQINNFNATSLQISNLVPGTAYDVYLQAVCDEQTTSAWIGPVVFNTPAAATIFANAGQYGAIDPSGVVYVILGQSQTFTITPDTGYEISDLLVDGVSVGAISTYNFENVTANHTINASFNILTYTINASAGANGNISPSGNVNVNYGQNQTFTITPDTGFEIADVLVDGVSVGAVGSYTFSNVTANHTIEASFSLLTYTITAPAGSGGSINPEGTITVNHGGSQTFTITPDTGYEIADVLVDGVSVGAVPTYTFTNVTANHTIEASFSLITFTITASAGPNGNIDPTGNVAVNYGQGQTFTISPNTGYEIADVLVDGVSVGAVPIYTFTNVTANHIITASFFVNEFTIQATAGPNGTIAPSGTVTVSAGENQTFTILPNTGYHIADVVVDGTSIGPVLSYTFANVMQNHTTPYMPFLKLTPTPFPPLPAPEEV